MDRTLSEIDRYINVPGAHGPSWSPDSTRIAFIADIDGLDQAWLVDANGGDPEPLTHFDERIDLIAWSPTSEHLLVTSDVGGNEHYQLYLISGMGEEPRELTKQPDVIHHFGAWSPDGRYICYSCNSRDRAFFDVWVLDISSDEAYCVLEDNSTLMPQAWSPDGTALIVSRNNTSFDNDLLLVSLKGDKPRLLTAHTGEAEYISPRFAPDGRTLYALTNLEREFLTPVAMDLTTLTPPNTHVPMQELVHTKWDTEENLTISPMGNILAWALNEDGRSKLVFYDVATRQELPAPQMPTGVIKGLIWAPNGKLVAFDFNGTRHNGNIWTAFPGTDTARQLTTLSMNGLNIDTLVEPALVHYSSFDGLDIPAYYYQPETSSKVNDRGLPIIVFVHGGPASQFRPLYASPTMPPLQYFLSHGFGVFAPNVRGSRGYGKTFMHLDDVKLRPNSVADIKAAVSWLVEHGGGDPQRIGIVGRSYGGFMVLAAITDYPDLWAVAVDIVGIANFLTFFENTGVWRRHLRMAEYGDPERNAEFLRELSPLFKANRIKVPLLVLHGVNDPRVPVSEAEQIVAAVHANGHPAELILFPNEGHFMLHQTTQRTAYLAIMDWFERYIG